MLYLSKMTRCEVFFSVHFHLACEKQPERFLDFVSERLQLQPGDKICDQGFEVCLFRDYAMSQKSDKSERKGKSFEKITFDNVFVLNNGTLIIVEAKAHQGFNRKQIRNLRTAKEHILKMNLSLANNLIRDVRLIGLCSSKYTPHESTVQEFDALVTWEDLSLVYPNFHEVFERANNLYNDRQTDCS